MARGAPFPEVRAPRRLLSRRSVFAGGSAALLVAGLLSARRASGDTRGPLSVQEAHQGARSGALTLVDIRQPDEWAATGLGEGAIPLDMRDPAFAAKLRAMVSGMDAPIALICASGGRSRWLSRRLREAGFTHVMDVPEGMSGTAAGSGWLASGLPVVRP